MNDLVTITYGKEQKQYKRGTTLYDISRYHGDDYAHDIILAQKNGAYIELGKHIDEDCEVSFVTMKDTIGHKTYVRGITMLMLKALYKELGRDVIEKVSVEYAIGSGYYCEIKGNVELSQELLTQIENRMKEYVEKNLLFEKVSMNTGVAMKHFHEYKMYDKEKLIKYRRSSRVNIYRLGSFEDYYYGYMPYSTGVLKHFRLELYEKGFVFVVPDRKNPDEMPQYVPSPKLYNTLQESNNWGKMMEVDTVGALNDIVASSGIRDLILVQEALHEKKIGNIAEQIYNSGHKKFVMIAGPSSSGKTTFSHRLAIQLRTLGMRPHTVCLDDYFVDREFTPKDENGKYNFECLEAIDVKQFNEDMTNLLNGKTVQLPTFNFLTGKRELKEDRVKKLGPDDILVIEGIHGLNDELSYSLPKDSKFKIYISALTQLNIDEHNRIPTTDGRMLRRIIRDARTRGASAKKTISMWSSVRLGEDNYIFPFQEEADAMFNSALIYELAVLKQYVEPLLFQITPDCEEYVEAKRLLKFLDYFIGVTSEEIPINSILREFIGGSIFTN